MNASSGSGLWPSVKVAERVVWTVIITCGEVYSKGEATRFFSDKLTKADINLVLARYAGGGKNWPIEPAVCFFCNDQVTELSPDRSCLAGGRTIQCTV